MWKRMDEKFVKGISKKELWTAMTDINNWPKWHGDLDYCKFEGDFVKGNHFILKPSNRREVKVYLVDVVVEKQFTDCTHFFGAKMFNTHSLIEQNGGVLVRNELIVTGPLKWLWIKLVAQQVADSVPDELDGLIRRV